MLRLLSRPLLFTLAVFGCLVSATAQVRTTGQISGTVADPTGAVIAGATVTAHDVSTGITQSANTNASGQYSFPNLLPGTYEVKAAASGFSTAVYNAVTVQAGLTRDLDIKMQIGAANQQIEVSAQGAVLETTTNTLATTIDPEQIQNLPLAGRDILPMAELVPGAQTGGDERFTTYNSLPNGAVNITIDGTSSNSQRYRTSTTGFYTFAPLRLGAFDEVSVATSELTADAGAEGSTQVRFVTKRGTNQFHGNVFWQAINSYFSANSATNNALGITRPLQVLNDWGGSLGGPILKDRLFFFVNFEGINQKFNGLTSSPFPTAAAQAGNFTYIGTDGVTRTVNLLTKAAQQNPALPSVVNPIVSNMFTAINGYAAKGAVSPFPGLPYEQTLNFTQVQPDKERYPTARIDFQITPKIAWHASWDLWWRDISNEPVNYIGAPEANGFKSTYYVASNGIDWTISPNLINQANFGIQSNVELFNPGSNFNVFQNQGNFVINAAPLANGAGNVFAPIIPGFVLPQPRNNPVWNVYDNLNWKHGDHTFTFGGDLRISNSHELEINNPPAINLGLSSNDPAINKIFTSSNFPNIDTSQDLPNAEALYATLVGRINFVTGSSWVDTTSHQYQILGKATNWEKQTVGGIYFQDQWRMKPHLALNYGFRWQFSGAVHNTNGLWTGPTVSDFYGPSTSLFKPGTLSSNLNPQIHLRPNPYSGDFRQPAPNLGFAWNPTFDHGFLHKFSGGDNLVIRGGIQISHYDEGWVPIENVTLFGNPGGTQTESLFPGGSSSCGGPGSCLPGAVLGTSLPLNNFPASFSFPQPMSNFFPNQGFSTINPRIRSPYVESWNFGIQRKLPGNSVLEINYVGNHAVHMWMAYDMNETNIFENGFLQEFKNAQANLVACENVPSCAGAASGPSFQDTGLPGQAPLPIFDAAFAAGAGARDITSNYTNSTFTSFLQQGQAGALANQLATQGGGVYFCNMVGSAFAPCGTSIGPGKYPINFFQLNPYAAGSYLTMLSNPGSSSYNGLQVQLKHQFRSGLDINANYAYSHSFTNRYLGDYFTADSALVNFVTLRDPNLSRGPSPYDQRHTFRTYFTYELPFGTGKHWRANNSGIDRVIGGWTVGSIITVQSGRNFKLQGGRNTFNFSNAYWPNASDSGVVLNGVTVSQLQSKVGVYQTTDPSEPKVFLQPNVLSAIGPETTPGQLGQMVYLVGPKFVNTDISLVKSIPIKERVHFNIYAEFLNAFNHPNWTVIDGFSSGTNNPAEYANVVSSTFSKLSLANRPRNIQFRLEVAF